MLKDASTHSMFFFTTMGEVASSKWSVHSFLWLRRIEGNHLMNGLFIRLHIKLVDLTTSDMCVELFPVDWTVWNFSWTPPNAHSLAFENWQPDSSIIRRLNIRWIAAQSRTTSTQHFQQLFQKYTYFSYGPDTRRNHSKIHIHHQKGPSSKTSIFKKTLLIYQNSWPNQIQDTTMWNLHWYIIAGYYDTFVEKYKFCAQQKTWTNHGLQWIPKLAAERIWKVSSFPLMQVFTHLIQSSVVIKVEGCDQIGFLGEIGIPRSGCHIVSLNSSQWHRLRRLPSFGPTSSVPSDQNKQMEAQNSDKLNQRTNIC